MMAFYTCRYTRMFWNVSAFNKVYYDGKDFVSLKLMGN